MPRSHPYFEIICNILGSGCSTVNKSLSTQEDRGLNPVNTSLFLAVVVEQLTGRSLTIPEDPGLNPVIGNVIKQ